MLHVEGINAGYGHALVLHDVSLTLKMVFIVGRNGASKTTLLKTICGLMKPSKGSITYRDKDTQGLPLEKLAQQGFRLLPRTKKSSVI